MEIERVEGLIARRILVNFRCDPEVVARVLPPPFRPRVHAGSAVAGICLIRLEGVRPPPLPALLGLDSENAAHRIAVVWEGAGDGPQSGVYIPRRDTGSLLNHLAGGRLFPGEHARARFRVREAAGGPIALEMRSDDGEVEVRIRARPAVGLPAGSIFASVEEASEFFRRDAVGYSATRDPGRLDGVRLVTHAWRVEPLAVDEVFSSFFADARRFPPGSVAFDHALLMRGIPHRFEALPSLALDVAAAPAAPAGDRA